MIFVSIIASIAIISGNKNKDSLSYSWIRLQCTDQTKVPKKANNIGEKYSYGYSSFIVQKSINGVDWITNKSFSNLSWNINAKEGIDKTGFNQLISLNKISSAFNTDELAKGNIVVSDPPARGGKSDHHNFNYNLPYESSLTAQYFNNNVKNAGEFVPGLLSIYGKGETSIDGSTDNLLQNYIFKKSVNNDYKLNLKTSVFNCLALYCNNDKLSTNISLSNDDNLNLSLTNFFENTRTKQSDLLANNGFSADTHLVLHVKKKINTVSKIIKNNILTMKTDFNLYNYITSLVDNSALWYQFKTSDHIIEHVNNTLLLWFANTSIHSQNKDYPEFKIANHNIGLSSFEQLSNKQEYSFWFNCSLDYETYYWFSINFKKEDPNSLSIMVGKNKDFYLHKNLLLINYFKDFDKNNLFIDILNYKILF